MFKVDLHTHSEASPDGGITAKQYQQVLNSGTLDYIAITDHNTTDFAQQLQQQLGPQIIVGEEIMTTHGEIIGLYLTETIPGGLSPDDTIAHIQAQGGLVYIPHPFETVRKGLHPELLDRLQSHVDIVETCNGRVFLQNKGEQAVVWSRINHIVAAASSDAHGLRGLGRTYTDISQAPTRDNLIELLTNATLITNRPTVRGLLYPKYHRIRKKVAKKH